MVERLLCKQDVVGSTPSGSTTLRPAGYAWRSRGVTAVFGEAVPGIAPEERRRAGAIVCSLWVEQIAATYDAFQVSFVVSLALYNEWVQGL